VKAGVIPNVNGLSRSRGRHARLNARPVEGAATFTLAHLQEGRRAQRCWINLTAPLSPSLT
jgi:hypothetical protein